MSDFENRSAAYWHVGRLHFDRPDFRPMVRDNNGQCRDVPPRIIPEKLAYKDGILVAFRRAIGGNQIGKIRRASTAAENRWFGLLNRRASKKLDQCQSLVDRPFEPSGVLRHVLNVERAESRRNEAHIIYDLVMDARSEIVNALRKRRESRSFDDVI
jgi:hypothetical protein